MSRDTRANRRYRSQEWFDNPNNPGMTALYLERYQNQSFTQAELQAERPIIGIAQTGSDLVPCNKIHVFLMNRIKAGIRDAGGIPMEFPVHPIQETGKKAHRRARPEPAIPEPCRGAARISHRRGGADHGLRQDHARDAHGGPRRSICPRWRSTAGRCSTAGTRAGARARAPRSGRGGACSPGARIGYEEFMELACASSPSLGHCNTMGTASTMNALAEALGMAAAGGRPRSRRRSANAWRWPISRVGASWAWWRRT